MTATILSLATKTDKYTIFKDFVMGVHQAHTQTKPHANYVRRL